MSQDNTSKSGTRRIGRRALLKGAALAAPALAAGISASRASTDDHPPEGTVAAGSDVAITEIATGKVAGYLTRGIYAFKGIPYADTTAGANRFLPPQKPKPWSGVRSSRQYSFVCPQDKGTGRQHDEEAFIFQWNDSIEGEDCLRVNVWTPGVNDNRKRPVMVWLHGGGFAAGSGNDIPAFDGENLARHGDVVVVTLNHRLNFLGYMDLSKYGAQYASSGNAGMLDIVAALEWVRDNITAFGGDPGCVTVFGQSGGGAKASILMAMPSAKGLFHRAIVESGSFLFCNTPEKAQRLTDLFIAELGLGAAPINRLQTMPYDVMLKASDAVMRKANPPMGPVLDIRKLATRLDFNPVIDGKVLPEAPFKHKGPALTADVPMIIGTTLNEFANGINRPDFDLMSEAELETKVEEAYPGHGKRIVAAFRKRTPSAKPVDIWSHIAAAPVRQSAVDQAAAKAALGAAPAYLYWFAWQTPILDGRPRAFHCSEIPFVFCNTDRCGSMTGAGPRARALSTKIADAWVHFARTGNPNHPGIPAWSPYSAKTAPTMIWDDEPRLALDPDGAERKSLQGA